LLPFFPHNSTTQSIKQSNSYSSNGQTIVIFSALSPANQFIFSRAGLLSVTTGVAICLELLLGTL
jgi:hypothetical protein